MPDGGVGILRNGEETPFAFARDELPMKGHYRFSVRPLECFGKKGEAIVSETVEI